MCELSIVIVSYNNLPVLINCLDSVIHMNDIQEKLEIIVVEQSPTSEIYVYIGKNYPHIKLIRTENKGFGAGNNRGVEVAKGKYLLFLNPDTVLLEPIAKYAVEMFKSNSMLGLFGVRLLDEKHNETKSYGMRVPFGFMSKIQYKFFEIFDFFNENMMYIQGADMFVRKAVFDEVGGFDESFFMYGEEADLCQRIRNAGFRIQFDKSKKILHLQGECSPDNFGITYQRQLVSFKKYCDKFDVNYMDYLNAEERVQKLKMFLLSLLGKKKSKSFQISSEMIKVIRKYKIL